MCRHGCRTGAAGAVAAATTLHGTKDELGHDARVDEHVYNLLVTVAERVLSRTTAVPVNSIPWRAVCQQRAHMPRESFGCGCHEH